MVTLVVLLLLAVVAAASIFAITRHPYPVRMVLRSQEHYLAGRYQQAFEDAEQAINADRDMPYGWILRACARQRLGDYVGAIADFSAAEKRSGGVICHACMGHGYARRVESKLARLKYEEALNKGCHTAETYAGLGYCLYADREFNAAIDMLNEALRRKPDLVEALYVRALCEEGLSRRENRPLRQSAVDDINRAIRLRPEACQLYATAAAIRTRVAHHEAAEDRAAAILELLELAVSNGLDRNSVSTFGWLPGLEDDPNFIALVARAPGKSARNNIENKLPDPSCEFFPILPSEVYAWRADR
jgi:tetratricopeptide (TPR) repeat protein